VRVWLPVAEDNQLSSSNQVMDGGSNLLDHGPHRPLRAV
jgi:hypothetical protein